VWRSSGRSGWGVGGLELSAPCQLLTVPYGQSINGSRGPYPLQVEERNLGSAGFGLYGLDCEQPMILVPIMRPSGAEEDELDVMQGIVSARGRR
jgi:hypothetical protein